MNEWNQFSKELFRDPLCGPTLPELSLPPPISHAEFGNALLPKPRSIVEGLLDDQSLLVLGGGSKTYKTWTLSDLALAIAAGRSWWNFPCHQYPVLYANFELKDYYAQQRFNAIAKARGIPYPKNLFIWNLRGKNIAQTRSVFRDLTIKEIQARDCAIMIVDPFYKLLGQNDERISAELVPVFDSLDEIIAETNASVLTANHYSKGNQSDKDPMDRPSGGAIIGRHPDGLVTLTKHECEGSFTVDVITRDFAPMLPFVISWSYPLLLLDNNLDPLALKRPKGGRQKEFSPDQFLELLKRKDNQLSSSQLQHYIMSELGCSRSMFFELKAKLLASRQIFFSVQTDKWNVAL